MKSCGKRGYVNEYYYSFFDEVFEKNQLSPFPAGREVAYTLLQGFMSEMKNRVLEDGLEEFYKKMNPNQNFSKNINKKFAL